MIRKILLPTILGILAYGFWISPDFKQIAAGVAIFLFGMLALEEGFKAFTGGLLENLLRRTTNKLWKSLSFGIVSTTIMQSSSLVSVITISFLSAGLIPLAAGIGIIFGTNLGTTTGAWLVAGFGLKVKISAYAMPMLVFGIILVFQKSRELKGIGYVLAGLGFLFLGIHHMKEGFDAFKDSIDLAQYAVAGYPGIFLFALLGLIATVVMQSSHATLVLIITALAAQQITYENALALAIGANIGTTITAIIGALSANVEGRRLAAAHLIFNVVTAFVAIALIYKLAIAVDSISAWLGIAETDYTLKLAVFHTLFNALGIVLMLPLIGKMVVFLEKTFQRRARTAAEPRFLNDAAFELGDTAIEAVRKETLHLYDNAFEIIASGLSLHGDEILSDRPLKDIVATSRKPITIDIDKEYNDTVKNLYAEIVGFIGEAQTSMTSEQAEELFELRAAGRDIVEAIKDTKHLQKNLSNYLNADNAEVRQEYDAIRCQVARVMRQLDDVRKEGEDSAAILSIDTLKLEIKESDNQFDHNLDGLVRKQLITPQMATSLMNDGSYAYDVSKHLIKMGEILFSTGSMAIREAERSLALDDEEMALLMEDDINNQAGANR
ncbi:sodium:phosphate symporter [Solemya velum gill symbiont]|uniref:Sodium:phosphate symporter n=2 Tax=Solemya velum gill symbiont TaxID=2340 RepID=A0A1T2CIC5_SOVGS|nr:Na/Pi symporter [Solemya velum gill symbiont]OOY34569.1 sodium:phosphate symporter [Solemya velum gill symbiont]OOY37284.1 sodium:phosphate symporter [Solemya velum gill symbiont]OOY40515.1 sodium:phosphate symporter [Solemya velum gill symbiont]OOY45769.1 sodium:phosphate symporter [Solemya velum gill symbiont]OOY47602.1 sodium:phosphate symporter [Solemya velum gill symbiont]